MRIVPRVCKRSLTAFSMTTLVALAVTASPVLAAQRPAAPAPAAQKPAANPGKPDLTVMTRNLYVGADILAVAGAEDAEDFLARARAFILGVAATNFPERAEALAAEIADKTPDVVGMQEVYDFKLNGFNTGAAPFVNYLDVLLAALERRGAHYRAVAKVKNADITTPVDLDGDRIPESRVSVVDHDVILVRSDLLAVPVPLGTIYPGCRVSLDGCNYNFVANVTLPVGSINFERGFVAAQVQVAGKWYVVFNTHLEVETPDPDNPFSTIVQAIQATELKSVVDGVPPGPKVIMTGDFNSSPEDPIQTVPPFLQPQLPPTIHPPYRQLTAGVNFYGAPLGVGHFDAWTLRPGRPPGLTCCEEADLLNPWSVLYKRIDLVFSREAPAGVKANVVGNSPEEKTPSGFWPSDHAGVVVRYTF